MFHLKLECSGSRVVHVLNPLSLQKLYRNSDHSPCQGLVYQSQPTNDPKPEIDVFIIIFKVVSTPNCHKIKKTQSKKGPKREEPQYMFEFETNCSANSEGTNRTMLNQNYPTISNPFSARPTQVQRSCCRPKFNNCIKAFN